jgi:hypothetical protein
LMGSYRLTLWCLHVVGCVAADFCATSKQQQKTKQQPLDYTKPKRSLAELPVVVIAAVVVVAVVVAYCYW